MFILKKLITIVILPPGSFIFIQLLAGIWMWRRNQRRFALITIAMALMLWALSTATISCALIRTLEAGLTIPKHVQGDVIILLGGGVSDGVQDLTGSGTPSEDMMARLVTAVRLQRQLDIPILFSGGNPDDSKTPESLVVGRFLADLGVKKSQVLLESRSRDTQENALYCREILRQHGFSRPLLVTSAYHMRRSIQAFQKAGVPVTPLPAQFMTGAAVTFHWGDFLPYAGSLLNSAAALHEYFGLLFYRLTR
jgi:uncharacterized SAM-binding protein YcdF (DUF218 family)